MGLGGIVYDVIASEDYGYTPPDSAGARLAPINAATFAPRLAPLANPASPAELMIGRAGNLPAHEQTVIAQVAGDKDVDALALAAIRIAENGGPGREFGVLSVIRTPSYLRRVEQVGTFRAQAEVAADSLKASEARYRNATGGLAPKGEGGRYTQDFWRFFGARWAPIDAENDPQGLNRYWVSNVIGAYEGSSLA